VKRVKEKRKERQEREWVGDSIVVRTKVKRGKEKRKERREREWVRDSVKKV